MANQVLGMTNAEYRQQRGVSKSELDLIHCSPALIEWARSAPSVGSESVDLGTHVHCALLEPEVFAEQYRKAPKFDKRTKAGKEAAEAFELSTTGNSSLILDADIYDMVIAMRDSVLAHPVARGLLTSPGVSESSIFGELEGVRVKCRPDRIVEGRNILVDVKKTADMSTFAQSVAEFRYHVQAAFYSDVYEQLTSHAPRFVFVVVGERRSIGRHPVRVFELSPAWLETGREEYRADLARVREVEAFGCGLDVEVLDMPRWMSR